MLENPTATQTDGSGTNVHKDTERGRSEPGGLPSTRRVLEAETRAGIPGDRGEAGEKGATRPLPPLQFLFPPG